FAVCGQELLPPRSALARIRVEQATRSSEVHAPSAAEERLRRNSATRSGIRNPHGQGHLRGLYRRFVCPKRGNPRTLCLERIDSMKRQFLGKPISHLLLPLGVAALFLGVWDASVRLSGSEIFPKPMEVARGIWELIEKG